MKLPVFSIRTILGFIISLMGLLALVLALLSGSIHRDLVLNNQKIMMQEMISIAVNERLKDLKDVSRDLGLALQSTAAFQKALKINDKQSLINLFNNQFNQYFVTAGVINLEQLVLLDKNFSMMLESTDGSVFYKSQKNTFCPKLVKRARLRTGSQRMEIIQDLCLYNNKPINVVVVPVGGLRLKGYIIIVTDPSHNLAALETNLGMPLKLYLKNDKTIFQSLKWPVDENRSLISKYPLKTSSGLHILSISTAQNISKLSKSLQQARLKVLLVTGIGTLFIIGLSIFIMRRTFITPLRKLTYKLRHFDSRHPDMVEQLDVSGTKEIHEICEGFNDMSSAQYKAQKSDQQKSKFLANMSHEIRTPLTAIIGFSEMLYQNGKTKDWKLFLESIIRNGKHLHQLINDILDVSKIEANQLSIEEISVPVCNLSLEIDSLMGKKARDKGLKFEVTFNFPIPELITTDPTRLKQILLNLCSNAIKFTEVGSVGLDVSYDSKTNDMKFLVKDSGIGMSSEHMSALFKPFKQADLSTTRKYGGTGLGLYISKQLSEKLGGHLKVTSMLNVGSLFEVTVPAGETGEYWINSEDDTSLFANDNEITIPKLEGKILLAEDDLDNQKLITLYIENTGAGVEIVGNGKLAVEKGKTESFDLILMDMQMPEMGGIEAIEKLREANCTTPIATLTANAMKEDTLKSKGAGANGFITKPIDQKEFYSILKKYLSDTDK